MGPNSGAQKLIAFSSCLHGVINIRARTDGKYDQKQLKHNFLCCRNMGHSVGALQASMAEVGVHPRRREYY